MTYVEFVNDIKSKAQQLYNVNTIILDDIDKLNKNNVLYDAIVIVLDSATLKDQLTTYSMSFYYMQKQTDEFYYKQYADGITTLSTLAYLLEITNMQFTPFASSFKDRVAGVRGSFTIELDTIYTCDEVPTDQDGDPIVHNITVI